MLTDKEFLALASKSNHDALELAVKLGIAIIPPGSSMGTHGIIKTDVFSDCPIGVVHAPILDSDPLAATRRAIVMAAAELGQRL